MAGDRSPSTDRFLALKLIRQFDRIRSINVQGLCSHCLADRPRHIAPSTETFAFASAFIVLYITMTITKRQVYMRYCLAAIAYVHIAGTLSRPTRQSEALPVRDEWRYSSWQREGGEGAGIREPKIAGVRGG